MKVSIHKKLILNIIVRLKILFEALKNDSVVTVKNEINFFLGVVVNKLFL